MPHDIIAELDVKIKANQHSWLKTHWQPCKLLRSFLDCPRWYHPIYHTKNLDKLTCTCSFQRSKQYIQYSPAMAYNTDQTPYIWSSAANMLKPTCWNWGERKVLDSSVGLWGSSSPAGRKGASCSRNSGSASRGISESGVNTLDRSTAEMNNGKTVNRAGGS